MIFCVAHNSRKDNTKIKVVKPGGGIYAPVIACDVCGKPINDGHGNFLWNPDEEGGITEVYFAHKGCDNTLEQFGTLTGESRAELLFDPTSRPCDKWPRDL